MSDYLQELAPPDYRNLVINPSAEAAPSATWFASNGIVFTGSTSVTPVSGAGVAEYQVTQASSLPYYFAPFGPSEVVHRSAFKIPRSQTVSCRVQVRSSADVWVELQAQFYVWTGDQLSPVGTRSISGTTTVTLAAGDTPGVIDPTDPAVLITGANTGTIDSIDPAVFDTGVTGAPDPADPTVFVVTPGTTTGTIVTTTSTKLIGGAGWQLFTGFADSSVIPPGATHWSMLISVAGSEPAGFIAAPPPLGSVVYADQAMVTDSGVSLTSVAYVDGNQANAYWEGTPNYSTSRTGTLPVPPPIEAVPLSTADASLSTATNAPPFEPEVGVLLTKPRTATAPSGVTSSAQVFVPELTTQQVAQKTLAWKILPNNLCLKADIQLANLALNTIDDDGVIWIVSDIEGWWTLPEPDIPDTPRGWFDGSYETRGRYASRVFTLTGSFIPTSPSSVAAARGRLIRAMNLCHRGDWFMTHEDATETRSDTKGSKVWLSGQPQISTVNANGRTDFSIGFRAPDPIKYRLKKGVPPGFEKLVLKTNNRVDYPGRKYPRTFPWRYPQTIFGITDTTAMNYGDTIVWPTLTLAGPTRGAVNIINTDTGQSLRVIRKLNASEELVINTFTKEVTLNGVGNYRFYLDIDVDWLMMQPGPNRLYFEEETPGSTQTTLEVLWRSGWIG